MSKVEEYRQKLEEFEAEKSKVAKKFNPKDLTALTTKTQEVIHPELGAVSYRLLTADEVLDLQSEKDQAVAGKKLVWKMLHKADARFSWDDFQLLPHDVQTALIILLTPHLGFLRTPPTLPTGLKPA